MSNNNNFFLDILNKLLKINDYEIIILVDINNIVWFERENMNLE